MSPEALAQLGGGRIAYLRSIRSEEVAALFPQAPQMARTVSYDLSDNSEIMRLTMASPTNCSLPPRRPNFVAKLRRKNLSTAVSKRVFPTGNS